MTASATIAATLDRLSAQARQSLDGMIHLWVLRTPPEADTSPGLRALLTGAELARAARIVHAPAREEFVAGRAFLRHVLGTVLGVAPREVPLLTSASGKPHTPGAHFNLSHSEGVILLGVCSDTEIGVDVEWTGRPVEALELAESVFSATELTWLRQLPEGEALQQGFFRCWTRKEAMLKALGEGLARAPKQLTVDADSGTEAPARLEGRPVGWIRPVTVGAGYCAAAAAVSPGKALQVYQT